MEKESIRQTVWETLDAKGIARFPFPPHGRIPNVAGAKQAAAHLAKTSEWEAASILKCNPDAPQRPVRKRALDSGKVVYMAVPRLRETEPFIALDPSEIPEGTDASTISGAAEWGEPIDIDAVEPIDLIVSGSVAVDMTGTRIGKGEGYSDLEYGLLREIGAISSQTPVATTVHELQIREAALPSEVHDVSLHLIATSESVYRVTEQVEQPDGIDWSLLSEEQIDAMPVLSRVA